MKISKKVIIAVALLLTIAISFTYALTINILAPSKHGLWEQKAEDTKLEVSLRHSVKPNKIRTSIAIYNPTANAISANVTVYYEPDLASYNFNVTIASLDTFKDKWTVALDVTKWQSTYVTIDEY